MDAPTKIVAMRIIPDTQLRLHQEDEIQHLTKRGVLEPNILEYSRLVPLYLRSFRNTSIPKIQATQSSLRILPSPHGVRDCRRSRRPSSWIIASPIRRRCCWKCQPPEDSMIRISKLSSTSKESNELIIYWNCSHIDDSLFDMYQMLLESPFNASIDCKDLKLFNSLETGIGWGVTRPGRVGNDCLIWVTSFIWLLS